MSLFLTTGHLGVFSLGYDDLSLALNNHLSCKIATFLLLFKFIATVFCYSLGGCGGIFSPTLFFGGMFGLSVSSLVSLVIPMSGPEQLTLAVVGMSSCLGSVVRAPITGILIVFEMTHEFSLVPALMLGALVSQAVSRQFNKYGFYEALLRQDGHDTKTLKPQVELK